jgi:hypothetical protein
MGPQAGPPGLPQPGGGPPGLPQPGGGPPGFPQPGVPPGLPAGFDPAAIDAAMKAMNPTDITEGKNNVVGYNLSGDQVTDRLFRQAWLAFNGMKHLTFTNCPITNETFKDLARITSLEQLEFTAVKVSDVDLKDLSALPTLEKLRLNSTGLAEAGLKELAAFKHLKELKFEKENVADAAVDELKKALPECKVEVTK